MDAAPGGELGGVSSAWEPWVLSARAKAFAVMFLMPEDALRGRRLGNVDSAGLRQIATEFHVSPRTAAWHLGNLRVISEERRDELLQNA
jgi:Zn-dependent peptidase ImmA (M78 family)